MTDEEWTIRKQDLWLLAKIFLVQMLIASLPFLMYWIGYRIGSNSMSQ